MRKTKISHLEKLKAQQAKIAARIQAVEARAKVSERKQDTRRKILVGSYYLDVAKKNNQFDSLKNLMDGYLKRNSDRALFELPALAESVCTTRSHIAAKIINPKSS